MNRKSKYLIPFIIMLFISFIDASVVADESKIDLRDRNNIVVVNNPNDKGFISKIYNKFINNMRTIGDKLGGTYYEDFDFKKYIINGQGITKEEITSNPKKLKELLKNRENEGLEGIEVLVGDNQRHTLVDYVNLLNRDIRDRIISKDTVWSKEKGPYYITGQLIIEKGNTLTIEAGTEVYFKKTPTKNENGLIIVEGNLIANGSEEARIIFRPYDETSSKGSWSGIYVGKKGSIDLNYTDIDKAGFWSGAAIYSEGRVSIGNSNITNTSGNGITAFGDISVIKSKIDSNEKIGIDIYAKDKSVDIVLKDNTISNNGMAARTVYRNGYSEVYEASNNSFIDNRLNAMRLYGDISGDIDLDKIGDNAPYSIPAKTVTLDNREKLVINDGANVTLNNGSIKFERADISNFKARIEINGTLNLIGSEEDRVYISSELDDEKYGDTTLDGSETIPMDEEYEALIVNKGASLNLNYVDIRYGGANVEGKSSIVNYGDVAIDNSIIRNAYNGVYSKGNLTLNNSEIYDLKGYAMYVYPDDEAINLSINNNIFKGFKNYFSKIYIKNSGITSFDAIGNKLVESTKNGTELIADISSDTELMPIVNDVPYVVLNRSFVDYKKNDLYVASNTTLDLKAGTIIKMDNKRYGYRTNILIDGQINTYGTSDKKVYITSIEDDSVGGDTSLNGATKGTAGNWSGITISNNEINNINNTIISYADNALNSNGELIIKNSIIKNNSGTGIYNTTNTTLLNTTVENNSGVGLNVNPLGDNKLIIENSTFINNGQEAAIVRLTNAEDSLIIKNNSSSNNKLNGLLIKGNSINEDLIFEDQGSTFPYVFNENIVVSEGKTLKLLKDSIVKFKENAGMNVNGNLIVAGEKANMVNITSIKDDSIGGDTNNDSNLTSPSVGDYNGITINSTSKSNINALNIAYGKSSSDSIIETKSKLTVNESIIRNGNKGILSFLGLKLTNNTFKDISSNAFESHINTTKNEAYLVEDFVVTNNKFNNIGDYIGDINHNTNYSNFNMNNNTVTNSPKNGVNINYIRTGENITFTTFSNNTPYVVNYIQTDVNKNIIIKPNVVFKMNDGGNIYSGGAVNIQGTNGNRVIITSIHDDTILGDTENNGSQIVNKGAWNTINIGGKSTISYCDINYGGVDSEADLSIDNSTIQNNDSYGVNASSILNIKNTKFNDNDDFAIRGSNQVVVTNSIFKNNKGVAKVGANKSDKLNINISSSNFIGQNIALDIFGECNGGIITGNNNTKASGEKIYNKINIVTNGILDVNKIIDGDYYKVDDAIEIANKGTLNINKGNIFMMAEEADFIVRGILNCNGQINDKVILTSISDKNKWKGLDIKSGATVEVTNAEDINSIKNFNFDKISTIKPFNISKNLLVQGNNSSAYVRGNQVFLYDNNTKTEKSIYNGSSINSIISNDNLIGIVDGSSKVVIYDTSSNKIVFNKSTGIITSISISKDKLLCSSSLGSFSIYNIATAELIQSGNLKDVIDTSFNPILLDNNIFYKCYGEGFKQYNYKKDETTVLVSRYNNFVESNVSGNNILFVGGLSDKDKNRLLIYNFEKNAIDDRMINEDEVISTSSIYKDKISYSIESDYKKFYIIDSNGINDITEQVCLSSGYDYNKTIVGNNSASFIDGDMVYNINTKIPVTEMTFYNPAKLTNGYSRSYTLNRDFGISIGIGLEEGDEITNPATADVSVGLGKSAANKIIIEKDSNGEDLLLGVEREIILESSADANLGVEIGGIKDYSSSIGGSLSATGSRIGRDAFYFGINSKDSYRRAGGLLIGSILSEGSSPIGVPINLIESIAKLNTIKNSESLQKYEIEKGIGTSFGMQSGVQASIPTISSVAQTSIGLTAGMSSEAVLTYGTKKENSVESIYASMDFVSKSIAGVNIESEDSGDNGFTTKGIKTKFTNSLSIALDKELHSTALYSGIEVNWGENYFEWRVSDFTEDNDGMIKTYKYKVKGDDFVALANKVPYIKQMKSGNPDKMVIAVTTPPSQVIRQIIDAMKQLKIYYEIVGTKTLGKDVDINTSVDRKVQEDIDIPLSKFVSIGVGINGSYTEQCEVTLDEGVLINGQVVSESPMMIFVPEDKEGLVKVIGNIAVGFMEQIKIKTVKFQDGIATYTNSKYGHNVEIEDDSYGLKKAKFTNIPLNFGSDVDDEKNIEDGCKLISNGVHMTLKDNNNQDVDGSANIKVSMYTNNYTQEAMYNYSLFYYNESTNKWEYVDSKKEITSKGLKITAEMSRVGQYAIGIKPAPTVSISVSNWQTIKVGDVINISSEQSVGQYSLKMEIKRYDTGDLVEERSNNSLSTRKTLQWIAKDNSSETESNLYKMIVTLIDNSGNEYTVSRVFYVVNNEKSILEDIIQIDDNIEEGNNIDKGDIIEFDHKDEEDIQVDNSDEDVTIDNDINNNIDNDINNNINNESESENDIIDYEDTE